MRLYNNHSNDKPQAPSQRTQIIIACICAIALVAGCLLIVFLTPSSALPSDQARQLLQMTQQAQTQFKQEHQRYSSSSKQLSKLQPQMDKLLKDQRLKLMVYAHQQAYIAQTSFRQSAIVSDQAIFSLQVLPDGDVQRSCRAIDQCQDGEWSPHWVSN